MTDFKQWVHFGDRCEGLIHRQTSRMYGMVRSINLHNWIEEQTYKNGRSHGISRIVYKDHVRIALNQDGFAVASFCFDASFTETERVDPKGFLGELNP